MLCKMWLRYSCMTPPFLSQQVETLRCMQQPVCKREVAQVALHQSRSRLCISISSGWENEGSCVASKGRFFRMPTVQQANQERSKHEGIFPSGYSLKDLTDTVARCRSMRVDARWCVNVQNARNSDADINAAYRSLTLVGQVRLTRRS